MQDKRRWLPAWQRVELAVVDRHEASEDKRRLLHPVGRQAVLVGVGRHPSLERLIPPSSPPLILKPGLLQIFLRGSKKLLCKTWA